MPKHTQDRVDRFAKAGSTFAHEEFSQMTASVRPARLLGIPLGDFGFFASVLLSLAAGFLTFFATCFLAIVALLVWNVLAHHAINYADSYRYVAFPAGLVVLVFGFFFFTGTWLRRRLSGAH
jgi:hypothetical protein